MEAAASNPVAISYPQLYAIGTSILGLIIILTSSVELDQMTAKPSSPIQTLPPTINGYDQLLAYMYFINPNIPRDPKDPKHDHELVKEFLQEKEKEIHELTEEVKMQQSHQFVDYERERRYSPHNPSRKGLPPAYPGKPAFQGIRLDANEVLEVYKFLANLKPDEFEGIARGTYGAGHIPFGNYYFTYDQNPAAEELKQQLEVMGPFQKCQNLSGTEGLGDIIDKTLHYNPCKRLVLIVAAASIGVAAGVLQIGSTALIFIFEDVLYWCIGQCLTLVLTLIAFILPFFGPTPPSVTVPLPHYTEGTTDAGGNLPVTYSSQELKAQFAIKGFAQSDSQNTLDDKHNVFMASMLINSAGVALSVILVFVIFRLRK